MPGWQLLDIVAYSVQEFPRYQLSSWTSQGSIAHSFSETPGTDEPASAIHLEDTQDSAAALEDLAQDVWWDREAGAS